MAQFRGFNFPFKKSATEFPARAEDDELVRQSIIQLILTGKGERVMRPEVGSNVFRFVFEDNDDVLAETLRAEIQATIGRHEPRAIIQDVSVENDREKREATVSIYYVVVASRTQGNITMDLPSG